MEEVTNINDGNWHGWNGGECPVHPETIVDAVILDSLDDDETTIVRISAESLEWVECEHPVIAFRVVEVYQEPLKEFWVLGHMVCSSEDELIRRCKFVGRDHNKATHVREVREDE